MVRGKTLAALMIVAIIGFVTATPAAAIDDLSLNVDPGSVNVQPGDTVTVTLDLANLSAPINGVQVRLSYDTSIMTLIDVLPTTLTLPIGNGWTEVSQTDTSGDIDWAAVITADQIGTNHVVATLTMSLGGILQKGGDGVKQPKSGLLRLQGWRRLKAGQLAPYLWDDLGDGGSTRTHGGLKRF